MDRTERKLKLPLIIGAVPFLMAGLDALDRGSYALAAVNLIMTAANWIAVSFVAKAPEKTNAVLHLCNAFVACFLSYDYFQQGKTGLPYAWIFTALAFLAGSIVFYRRSRLLAR
ncbi:MAG: hypothetical protein AAF560_05380 [Acidobacteriota bacterium]